VSSSPRFTHTSIPDVPGLRVVITGANSGIGLDAARLLAARGARVTLACRSVERGETARADIQSSHPGAQVDVRALDLSSLRSIRHFSEEFLSRERTLDVLINNAGIMAIPRTLTEDGFEMQLGTNHLGHFALTAGLLPALLAAPRARVVTVSSAVHRQGTIRFDDPHGERAYSKWPAYAQSKLANMLFTLELDRRIREARQRVLAVACHPGYAATNLPFVGPALEKSAFASAIMRLGNKLVAQPSEMGALPTVFAAVEPSVRANDFIGPDGPFELRGHPTRVTPARRATDLEAATRLWALSEQSCSLRFSIPASAD
jgi:NAD(P)-dependent dehydrogenase (short-subunit alcohol dehydrogenase family)